MENFNFFFEPELSERKIKFDNKIYIVEILGGLNENATKGRDT